MRLITLILLVLPSLGLAQDRYAVSFSDELEVVSLTACFDGKAPSRLYHSSEANRFTAGFNTPAGKRRLRAGASSTPLRGLAADSCIDWQVDLAAATEGLDARFASRIADDVVTDGDLWFWRGDRQRKIQVTVELPPGINISVPWKRISASGNRVVFEPAATPASWASRIAIGRFRVETLELPGSSMRMAILGSPDNQAREKLKTWMTQAATAVAGVHGRFPQASPQLILVPIGSRSNPVPWAHVMRGGGVSAEFFVDETRSLDELTQDWTACHELSHMLLPFVSRKDRWLSEGLASYYQYILLSRSGMLSEREAWQGLYDGTRRGVNGTARGSKSSTLAEATLQGRGQTMRVYWSGAAIIFKADTQLRMASTNKQSLDTALASLSECCLDGDKLWRARDLFSRLDNLTGTEIFSALYDEHVNSLEFPELSTTWESLGIESRFNRVSLNEQAPWAGLRKSISNPSSDKQLSP